jgi:hypothetical protein
MKKLFLVGVAAVVVIAILVRSAKPPDSKSTEVGPPTASPEPTPTPPVAPPEGGSDRIPNAPTESTGPSEAEKSSDYDVDRPPPDNESARPESDERTAADQKQTLLSTGMKMHADREGKINKCPGGQLELNAYSLHFICPFHSGKNVDINADQVKGTDRNGIESREGQKYHFDVEGLNPKQTETLLCDWLSQSRPMTCGSHN